MSSRGLTAEPLQGDRDPLDVALDSCRQNDRLPTLADLAESLTTALAGLSGVAGASVLVDVETAGIPETGWNLKTAHCTLRRPSDQDVRWVRVSRRWEKLVWQTLAPKTTQEDLPAGGIGPLEADDAAAGPQAMPAVGCPWRIDRIILQGQPLLGLFVVLEQAADSTQQTNCADQMRRMAAFMEPLLVIWSEASVLRTRLRQVTAETRALSRINQLQGRFVAMASHEFRTPLTSITAYTDVLVNKITDEQFPQAGEFLGVIKQEADRLLRMINRILDFSRLEFGSQLLDLKLLDLEPLVRETLRSLGPGIQAKRQHVIVQASRHLPKVEIDADLIRQVLVNLVGNAVKYTPPGGSITVRLTEEASTVDVAVCDDGPGINPADMKRIFNEFYRANGDQEGTGLGLSIARHILNLHGGHITVAPRSTGGTKFIFVLPKAADLLEAMPAYLTRHGEPARMQVLVVNLMRLLAELTSSPKAVMILRDGKGNLSPVCALGLDPLLPEPTVWRETTAWSQILDEGRPVKSGVALRDLVRGNDWLAGDRRPDAPWLLMPVARNGKTLGCVILGRRRGQGNYATPDEDQALVLADITATALSRLEDGAENVLTAIRALTIMRRRGVPTATVEALLMVRTLAEGLGLSEEKIRSIQYAAALHDAGMTRLDEEILLEEGKLSWDQRDEVDRHVDHGMELVAPLVPDGAIGEIIHHHHEWMDGSGYPDGLKNQAIPLGSRVLAVVDAWFSLTTDRPYRKGLAPQAALREMESHANTQFDPAVIRILGQCAAAGYDREEILPTNPEPSKQE